MKGTNDGVQFSATHFHFLLALLSQTTSGPEDSTPLSYIPSTTSATQTSVAPLLSF